MDIREIRKKLKMRQVDFAQALGVTITTVSRWENGFRHPDNRAVRDMLALMKGKKGLKTMRIKILNEYPYLNTNA